MGRISERQRRALDDMGIERWVPRAAGADAPATSATARARARAASGTSGPDALPADAQFRAQTATMDWTRLEPAVLGCTRCELHRTRTQAVFGVGDRAARWMLVGEAPGAEEDRQGYPFVGRAGQLLTAMLQAIGLTREQVYITNVLKCRPPGNRDPLGEEVFRCEPYLHRQVELVSPGIIVAMGRFAAQSLLKTTDPISRLRGRLFTYGEPQTPLIVTYHPAYLLRNSIDKRKAWADLCLARSVTTEQ